MCLRMKMEFIGKCFQLVQVKFRVRLKALNGCFWSLSVRWFKSIWNELKLSGASIKDVRVWFLHSEYQLKWIQMSKSVLKYTQGWIKTGPSSEFTPKLFSKLIHFNSNPSWNLFWTCSEGIFMPHNQTE